MRSTREPLSGSAVVEVGVDVLLNKTTNIFSAKQAERSSEERHEGAGPGLFAGIQRKMKDLRLAIQQALVLEITE